MYTYVYIHVYVYIQIYIYVCVYVHIHIYIHRSSKSRTHTAQFVCNYFVCTSFCVNIGSVQGVSENPFREIAGLFRMAPRGHVQTLTPRTCERRRVSCRCVRRGKCRSMKIRVLEAERTSSRNVNITAYIQPRGGSWKFLKRTSRSNGTFQRLCGTVWAQERWCA